MNNNHIFIKGRQPSFCIGDSVLMLGTGSWTTKIVDVIAGEKDVIYELDHEYFRGGQCYIHEEKIRNVKGFDWSGIEYKGVIEPYDTFTFSKGDYEI